MARYIDADLLEKAIDEAQTSLETNDDKMWEINKPYYKGLCWARGLLNDQPTADVVEVKHSRWENISGFDVCNICGTSPAYCEPKPNNKKGYPPYCHNCGADMRGDTDGKV